MRKLFKKSIACCLALALCFTLFAGAISANALTTTPSFSTEAVTATQGENAVIKFTVADFNEIQGVMLKFYVPNVVSEIVSVVSEDLEMVEWNDEKGTGNYEIGSDETGKYVKFMELANFEGVAPVDGFTFDITVAIADNATVGTATYPAAYIAVTDGTEVIYIDCDYGKFDVLAAYVERPEPPDTGMVKNGTFENIDGDSPSNWGSFSHQGINSTATITTEDAYTGSKSLKISKPGNWRDEHTKFLVGGSIGDPEVGKTYLLSAYVKLVGATAPQDAANFWFQAKESTFGADLFISGCASIQNPLYTGDTDGWVKVEYLIHGHSVPILTFEFACRNVEELWIDDLTLVEVAGQDPEPEDPVDRPEAPESTGMVKNGTFENIDGHNPANWGSFPDNGKNNTATITTEDAYTGKRSLKISKPGDWRDQTSSFLVGGSIEDPQVGKTYLLTAYVKTVGTTETEEAANFWFQAKDSTFGSDLLISGNTSIQNPLYTGDSNGWVKVEYEISGHTVPILTFQFCCRNIEELWIDDLTIVEVAAEDPDPEDPEDPDPEDPEDPEDPVVRPEAPESTGMVKNGTFENISEDKPGNWGSFEHNGVNSTITITTEDAYTGSKSLKISKPGNWRDIHTKFLVGGSIDDPEVGKKYLLSAYVKLVGATETQEAANFWFQAKDNTFGSDLLISGNTSIQNPLYTGDTDGWVKVEYEIYGHNVPIKTFEFGCRNVEEVWIDDLTLVEVVSEDPEEPEDPVVRPEAPESTGMVNNGTFENIDGDNPANWGSFEHNGVNSTITITTDDAYTGSKSLRISKPGNWRDIHTKFLVGGSIGDPEVGKAYLLSAYVKLVGATETQEAANFWFQAKDSTFGSDLFISGNTSIQNPLYTGNTDGWVKVEYLIYGHSAVIKTFEFGCRNVEEVWIDDLTLVEVELPEEPTLEVVPDTVTGNTRFTLISKYTYNFTGEAATYGVLTWREANYTEGVDKATADANTVFSGLEVVGDGVHTTSGLSISGIALGNINEVFYSIPYVIDTEGNIYYADVISAKYLDYLMSRKDLGNATADKANAILDAYYLIEGVAAYEGQVAPSYDAFESAGTYSAVTPATSVADGDFVATAEIAGNSKGMLRMKLGFANAGSFVEKGAFVFTPADYEAANGVVNEDTATVKVALSGSNVDVSGISLVGFSTQYVFVPYVVDAEGTVKLGGTFKASYADYMAIKLNEANPATAQKIQAVWDLYKSIYLPNYGSEIINVG